MTEPEDKSEQKYFSSEPVALWDEDGIEYINKQRFLNREHKKDTYTFFSGCDAVVSSEFERLDSFESIFYNVNVDGSGEFEIKNIIFTEPIKRLDNQTLIIIYANEYGDTAFEKIQLENLFRVKSGMSINGSYMEKTSCYKGKIIKPFQPIPIYTQNMSKENVENLKQEVICLLSKENKIKYQKKITDLKYNLYTKVILSEAKQDLYQQLK